MREAQQNRLIAALPDDVYARWVGQWQTVEMRLGDVLQAPGRGISHVYFPTTSVVSLLHILESGASAEVAVVGNEGIVGIWSFMGGKSTPYQSVVRSAGSGVRLPASVLMLAFEHGGPVAQLLLRYTQALITQVSQTAVATAITAWSSNCAAGCCSAWTCWVATRCG